MYYMQFAEDKPRLTNLLATALHEAGHALLAYRLKRVIRCVSVEASPGLRELPGQSTKTTEAARLERLQIALAGPVAETLFLQRFDEGSCEIDMQQAESLLCELSTPEDEQALLERITRQVKQIIACDRVQLTALALALLERGTLDGDGVRQVINESDSVVECLFKEAPCDITG